MSEFFLYYNYLPILAKHILDFPINRYPKGIIPRHNYPEFNPKNIKNGDIVFVKSDLLPLFFTKFFQHINNKFYLLSGVAGLDIPERAIKSVIENDKILKWIGCNLLFSHPKIMKIPIAFEEVERSINGPATGEGGDQNSLKMLYNSRIKFKNKKNTLLVTYIGKTHKSRNNLIENLKEKNFIEFADKLKFVDYMKKINNFKFVLCPRGCGTDTHRFWEVVLMGSVPILEKSGLDSLYSKFPCIIIDSYKNLNYELLESYIYDKEKSKNVEKYLFIENFKKKVFNFIKN